jgi:adenylate cyclase
MESPVAPDALREDTDTDGSHEIRVAVQSLGVGIALVEPGDWTLVFENGSFFRWFPPVGEVDTSLPLRLPGFREDRAMARLGENRSYTFETESDVGGRKRAIEVEVRKLSDSPSGRILVECRDISKQKQAEYMLESYSQLAEKNARELQREKERAERLLLNIMPRSVYEEMKDYGTVTPQLFEDASILMLDFVGSTEMAISRDPGTLITELNDIFMVFDRIAEQFGCERIRTVGDAYMAVSGLPDPSPEHAQNVARLALRMLRYLDRRNSAHPEKWICRIGIHSGPVVGSLVGVHKYVYDIFGPGVNLAARMEGLSEPMRITVSEPTYHLLKDEFDLTERGFFEVKGFGENTVYFLDRELPRHG